MVSGMVLRVFVVVAGERKEGEGKKAGVSVCKFGFGLRLFAGRSVCRALAGRRVWLRRGTHPPAAHLASCIAYMYSIPISSPVMLLSADMVSQTTGAPLNDIRAQCRISPGGLRLYLETLLGSTVMTCEVSGCVM